MSLPSPPAGPGENHFSRGAGSDGRRAFPGVLPFARAYERGMGAVCGAECGVTDLGVDSTASDRAELEAAVLAALSRPGEGSWPELMGLRRKAWYARPKEAWGGSLAP
mmetsp:Transcript_12680/g.38201  ORF Transcript_12680/g.38201 Transcript_12680/m.38201 type:complete len:108 (-) Transcript_12680:62-385(-)